MKRDLSDTLETITFTAYAIFLVIALLVQGPGGAGFSEDPLANSTDPYDTTSPEESYPTRTSEGLLYRFYEDHVVVMGMGDCYDVDVVIPAYYEGFPVTVVGMSAFEGCSGLRSITIPDTVTIIQISAFANCDSLESIRFSKALESIEPYTFSGCINLREVKLPNTLKQIGTWAFSACNALTSITIPESVETIGGEIFYGCSNLNAIFFEAETPPHGMPSNWLNGCDSATVYWGETGR